MRNCWRVLRRLCLLLAVIAAVGLSVTGTVLGARSIAQWTRTTPHFDVVNISVSGNELVTSEEIQDPQNLQLTCVLNGELMQNDNTADMIFSVAELISFLSTGTTLLPGTLILTGTPSGVGFNRKPPAYLMPGDTVEVTVEGIGTLSNPVELQ